MPTNPTHIDLILRELGVESKEAPLTNEEVDTNFINLRQGIYNEEVSRVDNVSSLQTQINSLDSRTDSLESEVDTLQNYHTTLASRVTTTESDIASLNIENSSVKSRVTTAESEIDQLQSQLSNVSSGLSAFVNVSGDSMIGDLTFLNRSDVVSNSYGLKWSNNSDSASITFVSTNDGVNSDGSSNSNLVITTGDNAQEGVSIKDSTSEIFYVNRNLLTYKGGSIWHSGNDGSGSNLDADKLDGQHGSYYATASHNHNATYQPLDSLLSELSELDLQSSDSGYIQRIVSGGVPYWDISDTLNVTGTSYPHGSTTTKLVNVTNVSTQALDSFNANTNRSAKYMIQASSGSMFHVAEVLLLHNGSDVFLTSYGSLTSSSDLFTVSGEISGNTVSLLVNTTVNNTVFKIMRFAISI